MVLKNGLWVKVQAEDGPVAPVAAVAGKGSVLGSRNEFGEKIRTAQPSYENEDSRHGIERDSRSARDEHRGRGRSRDRGHDRERSRERSGDRRCVYIAATAFLNIC